MSNSDPTELGGLVAQVVANDTELRDRVRVLVNNLIKHAEYTMVFGKPAERTHLMKAIMPHMLKALQTAEGDEAERERAEGYKRIRDSFAANIAQRDPESD
jgi:hypothetical protein